MVPAMRVRHQRSGSGSGTCGSGLYENSMLLALANWPCAHDAADPRQQDCKQNNHQYRAASATATEGAGPRAGRDAPPETRLDAWEFATKSKTGRRFVSLGPRRSVRARPNFGQPSVHGQLVERHPCTTRPTCGTTSVHGQLLERPPCTANF